MSDIQEISTADLCDAHDELLWVAEPLFGDYGGRLAFCGPISTVKAFEDNSLVRAALEEDGRGRVLVVDGGGSLRCAMLGDQLAEMAERNRWNGVIVNGCIRDSVRIGDLSVGVKALATHPRKSVKRNEGQRDIPVHFAGISFEPGHYLYADEDGLVVAPQALI